MKPRGKKAALNSKAGIERQLGRLGRINAALKSIEKMDFGIMDVAEKRRAKAKAEALIAEKALIAEQLAEVSTAIRKTLA